MRRIRSALIMSALFGLAVSPALAAPKKAAPAKAKAPAKGAKAAPKPAPPPKKVIPPMVNAEQKQINERYEEKIKATTDVAQQDRFRKDKKAELARVSQTYVKFDGKSSGWDVSIIEGEFAHHTGESLMERWENEGGKNNRRFFLFYNDRLWKQFISLDVSMIPEEKRNFDTFKAVMEGQYGKGAIEGGTISWRAGEFDARAVDKLKDYGALGLSLEDAKVKTEILALRVSKAPPKKETPAVIKAVLDADGKDHPDVKSNAGAVEGVIQAQGGKK